MSTIKIAPSILSADFCKLGSELDDVSSADWIHYDVMDGHFVPNLSFGLGILSQVKAATSMPVDVHLMISNPDEMIESYLNAGADVLCFHQEAAKHCHRMVSRIHERGKLAAMALNPGTPVESLDAILDELDIVLVMTVNPGYGGQSFIESSISKVARLKALCNAHGVSPLIEVDGGIDEHNAAEICTAGADVLVVGSSIFGQNNRAATIDIIRSAAEKGFAARP